MNIWIMILQCLLIKEDIRAPVPPPRLHSISHRARLGLPDLQYQSSAHTFSTTAGSASNAQNLQFSSLEDMTKEQLLAYVQIIQSSQPAEYIQPTLQGTNLSKSASANSFNRSDVTPRRSDLYINMDEIPDFSDDQPPPIPPKPPVSIFKCLKNLVK